FDSLVQKDESPRLHEEWAVFNTARFGNIYISRAVHIPSLQGDVPDANVLVVVRETDEGKLERLPDLNLPIGVGEGEVFNWEDPRVWELAGGEQKAILGLTAVRREGNKFVPHPALVEISIENGDLKIDSTTVFEEVGKNIVPIDDKFIYRPESKSHSLHLLVKPTAENKLALIKEIDFSAYSQVDWMKKKVGTVARPIDIGGNLRLLPIHGVRGGMGIDGEPKDDVYSVGFAIIDNDWNILAVSAEPFWNREDFLTSLPYGQGLRGDREKEVVYLDDWVKRGETFEFPLNVGDRITVMDRKNLSQLLDQKWIRFSDGSYQEFSLPIVEPESLPALVA
ncbi:MAG: hypothetical protein U1C56_02170, partial [Candidatus Curtissbacteria bacterium]|nr:hypothetical protein [Candidatus Curtissbacteria bacterium]